ncbi:hypothetical protein P8A22_21600 [Streptomyces laculatispora]|uniref:Uncharacterized protein n=1 Tax=Streptomyces laculatispora TaxID=887464 RepID=A0ABY9I633_9ACTN|nr:hypothetical protein [Streptomyces laculatispora]WLQ42321.1 hypothetical protein P8A22_21600 [Streptomyces laculatispora]
MLEDCPENCDQSCYRCLRSFRNRFEHSLLDRHVGASLLRYLIHGTEPTLNEDRLERSADTLCEDLSSRGSNAQFTRGTKIEIEGVGTITAPILAQRGDQQWIFGVHDPLSPDVAPTDELRRAKETGSVPVLLIDDMVISRNFPFATGQVLQALA